MKRILQQLEAHKEEILDKWIKSALEVYHPDTRRFYKDKKNRFSNPVGEALGTGLKDFLAALVDGQDAETLGATLEGTIQTRSVQDLKPSNALSFLFILKNVIKGVLKGDLNDSSLVKELEALGDTIDRAALKAFDIYLKYRERVFDIRVNDVKRQVSSLMKRTTFFNDDEEPNSDSG